MLGYGRVKHLRGFVHFEAQRAQHSIVGDSSSSPNAGFSISQQVSQYSTGKRRRICDPQARSEISPVGMIVARTVIDRTTELIAYERSGSEAIDATALRLTAAH